MSGGLSNTFENALLQLILANQAAANVGNTAGLQPSSVAGSVYASLHTATLTGASTQSTSEAAYTSYARVAIARTTGAWTFTGSSPTTGENSGAVTFPAATGGSETETYAAIGTAASGTGEILWWGPLTSSLAVSSGITPSFAINALQALML